MVGDYFIDGDLDIGNHQFMIRKIMLLLKDSYRIV